MVPGLARLEAVSAADLVGVLLVCWVVVVATLSTSGVDPATPPRWVGVVGLSLTLASLVVAVVLYRQTDAGGDALGTVWAAVPEWESDGRDRGVDPTTRRDRETGLRERGNEGGSESDRHDL
ncbi:hypothetical protein SAMN04487948_106148 [Halogranum amylolyticum]|uniref:Uncharacterized protein n=1 Tax=Halogranum amylolyticum TaxID=660520 RepID=A0A1H8TCH8_9EURY|nr:hypothetical protein [Halogranum amylolyticum]SEO88183.1 hypothetical protein SAMN04487948_106148 [Halogranum amylolyticum]